MQQSKEFVDLLSERRKDCDILWVSRQMNITFPHKLPMHSKYSRRQIIDTVLNSPKVVQVIETLAFNRQTSKSVVVAEALDILKEMTSKDHLPTVRWLGLFITKFLKRILISIYLNESTILFLKNQMQVAQVQYVYAPTHRSYLDFVLLSYILFSYDMALPNIASGMDFYKMRIVGELLRKTGAFYMRRSFSNDQLYKEIFKAYVSSLVKHSDRAIEFFIEGTRSRSQKSITPKYGLLAIILEVLFKSEVPDIQIIPMSINYDRPLEELLFAYELLGIPKPPETTTGLLRSLAILRDPFSYGNIYFNIAPPISAREYMDIATRKKSALSPNEKLPSSIVKNLAYSIIESHKKNTILTSFNLIAVLLNENIHSNSAELYSIDVLFEDYCWLQSCLNQTFGAMICTRDSAKKFVRNYRDEILESLKTHKDLLLIDSMGKLRLKERHKPMRSINRGNIKGHSFSEETMCIAIPIINLTIYTNPILGLLAKPAIAALSIDKKGIKKGNAQARYWLLRQLLSTELALPMETSEEELNEEWEELLFTLSKEKCIYESDMIISVGKNTKLFSLLSNLMLPFIAAIYITCNVISEWNNSTMDKATDKNIVKECQKRAEELLFKKTNIFKHPYTLSLDLYTTSLTSLLSSDAILLSDGIYSANETRISNIIAELDAVAEHFQIGTYLDAVPFLMFEPTINFQAKL